jgi:glycosyltransferase involved in cell wall biosynthesis
MELAGALRPHGVEIALASMGERPSGARQREAAQLGNLELFASDYKLEWMDDPWSDVERAGEWLLGLERSVSPDVVHLNGFAHGALRWHSPVLMVAHSCVLTWWRAVHGEPAPPDWDRYRRAVADGLRGAALLVTPTVAMLHEFAAEYSALPPARVIHNGRDASRFAVRAKEPFVLSAGRMWDEAKNVAALERAAPSLAWPVYIAGETHRPGDAMATAQHGARHLGPLPFDELAPVLGRASIYALPARYEPFGLSVLEAALSRCALVLGDLPSLRELWDGAACFVPPNDSAALTATLAELIAAPEQRTDLAARARTRALDYSPARMAAAYVAAYSELQATHSARTREAVACAR